MKPSVMLIGNFLSASQSYRLACEELADRLQTAGWNVLTTSNKPARAFRLVDMVGTVWQRRHEYDVAQVDVFSGRAFLWAEAVCWMLRRARKPYMLTLRGGNLPSFTRRWSGRVRRLLLSAAAVTVPSRYLYEEMRPYRSDLQLVPNALSLGTYRFRLRDKPRPTIIWLRAFHEIYNPSLAPKVLAQITREFQEANLVMLGPDKGDKSFEKTKEAAAELGMMDRFSTPGSIRKSEVPVWLDKGDIFLNTTNVDNTPVSVLEAMASGLCVVSTDVGGLPYLLEHEVDSLLVSPNDAYTLAHQVRRILTEPGLAERLSRNAREKAREHDWDVVLPRWESLLSSLPNCEASLPTRLGTKHLL